MEAADDLAERTLEAQSNLASSSALLEVLKEGQLDRFIFKLEVLRTNAATLEKVVKLRDAVELPEISQVLSEETLNGLQFLGEFPREGCRGKTQA